MIWAEQIADAGMKKMGTATCILGCESIGEGGAFAVQVDQLRNVQSFRLSLLLQQVAVGIVAQNADG